MAHTSLLVTLVLAALLLQQSLRADDHPPATARPSLLAYRDDAGQDRPVKTRADWLRRRAQILAGMQQVMGPLPDRSKLPPLDVKVLETKKTEGYTRHKLTFVAEKNDRVPAYLFVPDGDGKQRRPAMLALHQTTLSGKGEVAGDGPPSNMAYAPELAARGYVVLCPDYPSFGDYKYDFAADDHPSGTIKGVVNHMRAVDLLRSREEVDPERIGVIGHSLGGHNAMFVGAFDERLKVVVSSCGWTTFHDYYGGDIKGWTGPVYMPRLRDVYALDPDKVPFDFDEVVAALAPRAFFSSSPTRDGNFAVAGVRRAEAAARPVFELLGARDRLKIIYPECDHDFPPAERRQAFDFIDSVLKPAAAVGAPAKDDLAGELPRIAPTEPAGALKTFRTHPDFRMDLVAAEPLVRSPVAVAFDENGRMFVVEMRDYSEQDKEKLGAIKLLTDTDGDGRFEKATVYAEGLSWPTAVACYDGGVFVGAAPDLLYLKDHNGDGTADERKVVFTGFGRDNVQGLLNSFHWTLDNRIHGSTSSNGGRVSSPLHPDRPPLELRGRDFSFDPRALDLRPETGGGQHGMSFDDWGRKFVSANSDHIQMVMAEDRYLTGPAIPGAPGLRVTIAEDGPQAKVFRASPVEPWRVVRTRLRVSGVAPGMIEGGGQPAGYFTGATGVTIYRGDAWPAEYRGQAFIGDVGSNIVHRKTLRPDGVRLTARRADAGAEFVASTDTWFRPAQFANAPDGTLYVIDVYREVIEHPHSIPPQIKRHLDLTSGRDRGRIYRILPKQFTQRPPPQLGTATTAQLVETLAHDNGWHRDTAARLLSERQDPSAVPLLEKLAGHDSRSPLGRLHALYALHGARALQHHQLAARLRDEHPGVRAHALRLAEPALGADPAVAAAVQRRIDEEADPRVRYQLAFALGRFPAASRAGPLAQLLLRDGHDAYVRFAALTSADDAAAEVLERLAGSGAFRKAEHRKPVTVALASTVAAADATADHVAKALRAIHAIAERDGNDAALDAVVALQEGLRRAGSPLAAEVARDGGAAKLLAAHLAAARKLAADRGSAASAGRLLAVRALALGSLGHDRKLIETLLDNREPHEVQMAALAALDAFADPRVGDVVVQAWPGLSPRLRARAREILFARAERLTPFLVAIEAGKIPAADLDATRVTLLEVASGADAVLIARAKKLLAPSPRREDVIAAYRPALGLAGDAAKGRVTFRKVCAACHRAEGVGQDIGPSLAAAAARGPESVLLNVLDPNREVNPLFVDYVVETRDGRTLTGLLAAETATSVTLKRGEGQTDTVPRDQIKRMRSSRLSLMPEGLEVGLDAQAMADLLAYVMSLK